MDPTRATWTDQRLDYFALRIDQRLDRIDDEARRERNERARLRWDESQQRFESRMRALFWMWGVAFGFALATLVFVIATGA